MEAQDNGGQADEALNADIKYTNNERNMWGSFRGRVNKKKRKSRKKSKRKKKSKKSISYNPKIDQTCTCGISSDLMQRIVGGIVSEKNRWPWMVTLDDRDGNHYCGGSIISSRFILTAAHCININGERVLVKIGDHDKWTEERGESLLQGIAIKPKQYSSV